MPDVKLPVRHEPPASTARPHAADILVVALDDAGLAEALPVALARACALGVNVTVAGRAKVPVWWALATSGMTFVPRVWVEDPRTASAAALRDRVQRCAPGAECDVVCGTGRAERWLGRVLRTGAYGTVLVGAAHVSARRARRLEAIAGPCRAFAVLKPLGPG